MTQFFNRSAAKNKRRVLRQDEPQAEALLWGRLRDRRLGGRKFRRQYSVSVYVLDFYCPACHLAVELDGDSHAGEEAQAYDAARSDFLAAFGIQVIRFANSDVYQRLDHVAEAIYAITGAGTLPEETSPQSSPSEMRGGRKSHKTSGFSPS